LLASAYHPTHLIAIFFPGLFESKAAWNRPDNTRRTAKATTLF
jgi:hypothetical protein